MILEELFEQTVAVEKPGYPEVITEELESVASILETGDHRLEILPSSRGQGHIKEMPNEVSDHKHGRKTVDNSPQVEALLRRKDPLEKLEFVKEKRQPGDDEEGKSADEEPVLNPLGEVHPQKEFIVGNEGRSIHFGQT